MYDDVGSDGAPPTFVGFVGFVGAGARAVVLLVAIAGATVSACGSASLVSPDASIDDAPGPDGDLAPGFDGTIVGTVRPPNCIVASEICVDAELHRCVGDRAGELAEVCPDACSFGRCTSAACQDAEQNDALRGCRFYVVQLDNVDREDKANMLLILTNASTVTAQASLQVRSPAGEWMTQTTDFVPARGSTPMVRNHPPGEAGVMQTAAFRIESDVPISVVQVMDGDNVNHTSTSAGGTVLLPVHALGQKYLAVTAQQYESAQVAAAPGSRHGAGMITVVGTVDGTTVTLEPTAPAIVGNADGNAIVVLPGDPPFSITLDEGDALQVFSMVSGDDLSGTEIDADHPVEVLSGNTFTSYDKDMSGLNGADLAFEQLPPLVTWGKRYVGAWLAPQAGCDSYFGPGYGSWQLIASRDNTTVTFSPSPTTMFNPPLTTRRLGRGESVRFFALPDPAKVGPAVPQPPSDFVVEGSEPILLAQWLDCEPGLSWGVDTRFGRKSPLVVAFPPGFDNRLVLVRRAGLPVTIDDQPVSDLMFVPIDKGYEAARIAEQDLGRPCVDLSDPCSHVIQGDGVGVTWSGMDIVCSYTTTLPSVDMCILPGVSCPP